MTRPAPLLALAWPYSGGNLGDAAIMRSALTHLRAQLPGVRFVAITLNPGGTVRTHGIEGTSLSPVPIEFYGSGRWKPAAVKPRGVSRLVRAIRSKLGFLVRETLHWIHAVRYLRKVDALVFPGSGQFDEEFGGAWGHPYAMFKWATAARIAGAKVIVMSVGICHLNTPESRSFSRRTLNKTHYASLRDPWSVDFARTSLNVTPPALVPDLAFSLDIDTEATSGAPIPRAGAPLRIGISPIAFGHPEMWPNPDVAAYDNYVEVLSAFVAKLLDAGHEITFFNTDTPDVRIIEIVSARVRALASPQSQARLLTQIANGLPEVLGIISSLDLIVASRLHGVILSHVCGKAVLAISYDRKVTTHMSQIGHASACIELRGLQLEPLWATFENCANEVEPLTRDIRVKRMQWRKTVMEQYHRVRNIILPEAEPQGSSAP